MVKPPFEKFHEQTIAVHEISYIVPSIHILHVSVATVHPRREHSNAIDISKIVYTLRINRPNFIRMPLLSIMLVISFTLHV